MMNHEFVKIDRLGRTVQEIAMPITSVLKQADIFYELTATQLELVSSICDEKTYGHNAVIFEENSSGDELYVIADGVVDIEVDPMLIGRSGSAGPQRIATLRRGQSFGEVSLVDEGLRSASARSTTGHIVCRLCAPDRTAQPLPSFPAIADQSCRKTRDHTRRSNPHAGVGQTDFHQGARLPAAAPKSTQRTR